MNSLFGLKLFKLEYWFIALLSSLSVTYLLDIPIIGTKIQIFEILFCILFCIVLF